MIHIIISHFIILMKPIYGLFKYMQIPGLRVSLMAQVVKNLSTMQETQLQSLNREDPLEKGMATHSSILAWEIPSEENGSPWVHKESDTIA